MHKRLYNSLKLTLHIQPKTPLLIKAGGFSLNPALPDMSFVRTFQGGEGEIVYLPGASLKGVVRGFIERVLRSLGDKPEGMSSWRWACTTFADDEGSCARRILDEEGRREGKGERLPSWEIYKMSCGACRLFGHTRLRGRVSFTDFFPIGEVHSEIRYGVAISRLSNAVAHGPFEMEVVVDGTFEGRIILENFELWQVALLALALENMNSGLLKVGYGKNRGLGEVQVTVENAVLDELREGYLIGRWRGVGGFVNEGEKEKYGFISPHEVDELPEPRESSSWAVYARRIYDTEAWEKIGQVLIDRCLTDS